jgi:WD40 repeat protein
MMTRFVLAIGAMLLITALASAQAAVSPDGKLQAQGKGASVNVVDIATGKTLLIFKSHSGDVTGVAFSPDGKSLVSVAKDKKLCLMELTTGKLLATTALGDEPSSVGVSPDGKTIDVKVGNNVESFDAATLKKLK